MDKFNLDRNTTYDQFKGWAASEDKLGGEYYKALELFLWYCEKWQNERGLRW